MAAMASADIQIVNISNLAKIETFLNDSAYKELLENSENYNTRLCIERRLRMPFLDPQTGVAQNHCALFMKRRQRMPGLRDGQIYSYPSGRWRKSRRQYLIHQHRPFRMIRDQDILDASGMQTFDRSSAASLIHSAGGVSGSSGNSGGGNTSGIGIGGGSSGLGGSGISSASGGATTDNDSKDSMARGDRAETPKDWFYDEMNMHELDAFEDRDLDSDFDFDDGAYKKKRRGRKPNPDSASKRGRGRGRGRRKTGVDGDGATGTTIPRRRGRPSPSSAAQQLQPSHTINSASDDSLSSATATAATTTSSTSANAATLHSEQNLHSTDNNDDDQQQGQILARTGKDATGKAIPSPYCDFCLGDSKENKKTSSPEDLVSCSDCGRSGHPTCLQFTPNMIISVKRYRWQCIECKYCSICGTSDNDDQLLFCDDCDRGYHMYCLTPPLIVPPEGSWSCNICQEEFHKQN